MNKLKEYPKVFEDYVGRGVSVKAPWLKKYDAIHVSAKGFESESEYGLLLRETYLNFQKDFFRNLVKIEWLRRKFCFKDKPIHNGERHEKSRASFFHMYLKEELNINMKEFVFNMRGISAILSYLDDFFPDFNENNPFKEEFEYPYKYVSFEFLAPIHVMKERFEILEMVERKKMKYIDFLNYLVNYIGCYNEDKNNSNTYNIYCGGDLNKKKQGDNFYITRGGENRK